MGIVALIAGVLAEFLFDVRERALRVPIPMPVEQWAAGLGVLFLVAGLYDTFSDEIVSEVGRFAESLDRGDVLLLSGVALLLSGVVLAVLL